MSDDTLKKFEITGDILYNYMINNFNNFFENNTIINFEITDNLYKHIDDTEKITETYGDDIQKKLIPWIKKEIDENRLFNKSYWKPFRDQNWLTDIYLGYKQLFLYKQYYFQLSLENYYKNNVYQRISLALYGWKEDNSTMLQPYEKVKIPLDNIMPDYDWERE